MGIENPFLRNFNSLEELVDVISDILNAPITIEDANHRLLAYSMHDENTDSARVSTIIGRRVPEKVINSLWKKDVIPSLLTSDMPIRVNQISDVGLGNRVAISIRKNEEVLGFIWALEINKPYTEDSFQHLKNASIAAKNLLLKLQIKRNQKEENDQELFRKLLTGHIKSEEEAQKSFSQLGIIAPSIFTCFVFHLDKQISAQIEKNISYILKTTQTLKIILYRADEQDLIVLASPTSSKEDSTTFAHTFLTHMKERFDIDSIQTGIGRTYGNYTNVKESYHEALHVLKMKQHFPEELNNVLEFDSLGVFQILPNLNIESFRPPSIMKLEGYDQRNQSNYVHTLEVYLNNDANIQDTAKKLHIHTNTLTYRLKRISEIGNINLKNFNEKSALYLYLKLKRLN